MRWFKPKFEPECYRVGFANVLKFLSNYLDDTRVIWRNQYYRCPVNPAYVMRSIESYKYEYIPKRRECEGFCDIFKGELARLGYGDLLAMYVSLDHDIDHAVIGFMQAGELVFGDPQTGRMVYPEYRKINNIIF